MGKENRRSIGSARVFGTSVNEEFVPAVFFVSFLIWSWIRRLEVVVGKVAKRSFERSSGMSRKREGDGRRRRTTSVLGLEFAFASAKVVLKYRARGKPTDNLPRFSSRTFWHSFSGSPSRYQGPDDVVRLSRNSSAGRFWTENLFPNFNRRSLVVSKFPFNGCLQLGLNIFVIERFLFSLR